MSWVVEAFGPWYPTVYPHRDEAEAARLVATLASRVPLAGARLLDVGCGAGRHLPAFVAAGARPFGLDLSPALLAEARRVRAAAGGRWPLVRGDMRALPIAGGRFDVVTSLFTSFGYFGPRRDADIVAEWARVLVPGGTLVLDFLNRDRVRAHPNPVTERISEGWSIREERRIEEDGAAEGGPPRVVKRVRVAPADGGDPVADYEESVTLYALDDLRTLLAASGLRAGLPLGSYDGAPWNARTSPRLLLTAVRAGR